MKYKLCPRKETDSALYITYKSGSIFVIFGSDYCNNSSNNLKFTNYHHINTSLTDHNVIVTSFRMRFLKLSSWFKVSDERRKTLQ